MDPLASSHPAGLYLNVYSPRTPSKDPRGYPVILWIHGGGYANGDANTANGTALVELTQDVVFVSTQYRLNVFGFLGAEQLRSRDPEGSTGNYGLQDQRAAMAWVRRSIAAFGGDPSRVTIDGCSAGAGSTTNHMVNPRSWPFFAQANGESGTFSSWDTNTLPMAQAVFDDFAALLGCATAQCLVAKSTEEVSAAAINASAGGGSSPNNGLPWAPVVDGVDVLGLCAPWHLLTRDSSVPAV